MIPLRSAAEEPASTSRKASLLCPQTSISPPHAQRHAARCRVPSHHDTLGPQPDLGFGRLRALAYRDARSITNGITVMRRKPIGDAAMTAAERRQRRAKLRPLCPALPSLDVRR
jgi:hypothetical protein